MKIHEKRLLTTFVLSLLIFTMTYVLCSAQEWNRTEKSEIYGIFQTMDGDNSTISEEISDITVKVKVDIYDTEVYGIGLGYNFTEKWNLNMDFLFGTIDTKGTLEGTTSEINLSPSLYVWNLNLDYNFWKRRFSPLVTGGIGCLYFSGDEYNETDFSYNLGAGLRWDALDFLFIKAVYRMTWTKMEDHDNRILLDGISLGVGYMY